MCGPGADGRSDGLLTPTFLMETEVVASLAAQFCSVLGVSFLEAQSGSHFSSPFSDLVSPQLSVLHPFLLRTGTVVSVSCN